MRRNGGSLSPFQSTPSVGRATTFVKISSAGIGFQSTPSVGRATCAPATSRSLETAFQSTPSVGRATSYTSSSDSKNPISIHALRGEGDVNIRLGINCTLYFNPRPPWGGRLLRTLYKFRRTYFNPRPPWGGRRKSPCPLSRIAAFQSTPSVGRATVPYASVYGDIVISIHALRGEGDNRQVLLG